MSMLIAIGLAAVGLLAMAQARYFHVHGERNIPDRLIVAAFMMFGLSAFSGVIFAMLIVLRT